MIPWLSHNRGAVEVWGKPTDMRSERIQMISFAVSARRYIQLANHDTGSLFINRQYPVVDRRVSSADIIYLRWGYYYHWYNVYLDYGCRTGRRWCAILLQHAPSMDCCKMELLGLRRILYLGEWIHGEGKASKGLLLGKIICSLVRVDWENG